MTFRKYFVWALTFLIGIAVIYLISWMFGLVFSEYPSILAFVVLSILWAIKSLRYLWLLKLEARLRNQLEYVIENGIDPKVGCLQRGTNIISVCDFGDIKKGQPGIIESAYDGTGLNTGPIIYFCVFFGGVLVEALPHHIEQFEHGYSAEAIRQHD